MAQSLGQFEAMLGRFIKEFEDQKLKAIAQKAGMESKKLAERAASADLGGDPKFSGWAPTLDTKFDHLDPGVISFKPSRRSAGPWTVAEFGRNQAAGPRMVGPRLTKTGKVSKARQKRYNGRTEGKDTASDALKLIDAKIPQVVEKEVVTAIRRFFN